jgi:hypothetical protein
VIFGYVDMTVYFNGKKYQQLGFMHLKVDVIIFSKNESIFDFSRLRTTIYNWKNKRSLNSHKRYLSFKNALFFPSTLLEAPTIPLRGYSTVFEILDRGSEENETSYRNSEKPKMKPYPFAPDQK